MAKIIERVQCPECAKRGNDTAGDNLAVYSDGHSWCYACGYLVGTISSSSSKDLILPDELEESPLPNKGIGIATLRLFQIYKEKGSDWFVYPYLDKSGKLVGIKYRNFKRENGKKRITYEGEVELFGLNTIRAEHVELVLWEGESDTLSGHQINPYYAHLGFPGVQTAEKLLKRHAYWIRSRFDRVYICSHNDEAGEELRETVNLYLPGYKVFHMYVPETYNDFNDLLTANKAVKQFPAMLKNAVSASGDDLLTGKALTKTFHRYASDASLFNGYSTGFHKFDAMSGGGLHVGEVFALVGHTGRGKSTFARDVAMNIAESLKDDERILWIGTEMDSNLMCRKFIERMVKRPFIYVDGSPTISQNEQDECMDIISRKFVFYTELHSDYDRVENGMINAIFQWNVKVVIIDVLSDISPDFTDWQKASAIINRLHGVAQGDQTEKRPPISIFCVSHTVGTDESKITLTNLRGGSAIRQKVTGVVSFDGDIEDKQGYRFLNRLKKSRVYDGDDTQTSTVVYNREDRRYYEIDEQDDEPSNVKERIRNLLEKRHEKSTGSEPNEVVTRGKRKRKLEL